LELENIEKIVWDAMLDGIGGLITVGQAADMLQVTDKAVYHLIVDGKIEAVRIGKRGLRVRIDSVENYQNSLSEKKEHSYEITES
jgi:excisionase family DNA binding protein